MMTTWTNPDGQGALLPPHGLPPRSQEPPIPCCHCYTLTDRKELAEYGARCFPCYEAWRLKPQPAVDVGDKRRDGPRAWAYALKRREEAGEVLSPVQRDMWRAGIGAPAPLAGDAGDLVEISRDAYAAKQARVEEYARQRGIDL